MKQLFRKALTGEPVRFVIIGAGATVLHYGIYYLLFKAGMSYNPAYTLGYAASLTFNFTASVLFTFRTTFSVGKSLKFIACHIINYMIHIGLLNILVALKTPELIAPAIVLTIAVPVNFLLVRKALKNKTYRLDDESIQ